MGTYLITGVTGQVAASVATLLARDHEVVGVARFSDPSARAALEGVGVRCVSVDLTGTDLAAVPTGADVLANFAVLKTQRWDRDLRGNARSIGLLMAHVRPAAVLHCSSTGIYRPAGATVLDEGAPLGDNHAAVMPTYSISKIAAEEVVRTMAANLAIPSTIARLNVPYGVGPDGSARGWPAFHLAMMASGVPIPVHPSRPNLFNPIDLRDIAAMVPALVEAATVEVTTVNWAGTEQVSLEDWCEHLAERTGLHARFEETSTTLGGVTVDTSRMESICGPNRIPWRDGFDDLAAAYLSGS